MLKPFDPYPAISRLQAGCAHAGSESTCDACLSDALREAYWAGGDAVCEQTNCIACDGHGFGACASTITLCQKCRGGGRTYRVTSVKNR